MIANYSSLARKIPGSIFIVWMLPAFIAGCGCFPQSTEVLLEDFSDIVTQVDFGFNDFGGNIGVVNSSKDIETGTTTLDCSDISRCAMSFSWDFSGDPDPDAFTGVFMSLFGQTSTEATFDGTSRTTVSYPEFSLDLDRMDGELAEPGGPRKVLLLSVLVSNPGLAVITLRLELKDSADGIRFTRISVPAGVADLSFEWDFRNPAAYRNVSGRRDLDIHAAKELTMVVERRNVGDGVSNPVTGNIKLQKLWWTIDHAEPEPASDDELLDLVERRSYQYFLDASSRKASSRDIPQDRTTFGELLTVGGIGFAIPAHVIGASRGWIARESAAQKVLNIVRHLDNASALGPDRVGKIGYKGFFYHFFGTDGYRKLNFDFPDSPRDESLNTVEASTIDTGLALWGALVGQSYFDRDDPVEEEIRIRVQSIFDRVEWPFMLEPRTGQLYLAWKPNESRDGPDYSIPDADAVGSYSGTASDPATLDYYTDEALLDLILAIGSDSHPIAPQAFCHLIETMDGNGLVRTYPGSLFTYQFLGAFLDPRSLVVHGCTGESVDYFENSRQAILNAIGYAEANPEAFATYGPNAWGISAAEGPSDSYHAYGVPSIAVADHPEQDGTVTYYAMASAINFGTDLRDRAVAALRAGREGGHWHPRFGLPDAFHADINRANLFIEAGSDNKLLRSSGAWLQRAQFAIDVGPMLLHIENARSGLIWSLSANNANIRRGLDRLANIPVAPDEISLEAENGVSVGQIMSRGAASGGQTVWLHSGESLTLSFNQSAAARYSFAVRTSNDNSGPLETIDLKLDGTSIGQFQPPDTGDFGAGWNNFTLTDIGQSDVSAAPHTVVLSVSGGDGFGVEVDRITLEIVSSN